MLEDEMAPTVCLGQLLKRDGVVLWGVQLDGNLGLKLAGHFARLV